MHERDHEPLAAERDALVRLVDQQVLVGDCELRGERERGLRGFERIARQRMRGAHELALERGPQRGRCLPVLLGELEALAVAHFDAVGGGERIADQPRRFRRLALAHILQPRHDFRRPDFRRIRRMGVDGRQRQG